MGTQVGRQCGVGALTMGDQSEFRSPWSLMHTWYQMIRCVGAILPHFKYSSLYRAQVRELYFFLNLVRPINLRPSLLKRILMPMCPHHFNSSPQCFYRVVLFLVTGISYLSISSRQEVATGWQNFQVHQGLISSFSLKVKSKLIVNGVSQGIQPENYWFVHYRVTQSGA